MTRKTYRLTHRDGTPTGTYHATADELRNLCERGDYCTIPDTSNAHSEKSASTVLSELPIGEREAAHKRWALDWFNGNFYCPHCHATDHLRIDSTDTEGNSTISAWVCDVCDGGFRSESRDSSVLVEHDDVSCYEPKDWIEREADSPDRHAIPTVGGTGMPASARQAK